MGGFPSVSLHLSPFSPVTLTVPPVLETGPEGSATLSPGGPVVELNKA